MYKSLYGKSVKMNDRFESEHIWSEELALRNKGRCIPKEEPKQKTLTYTESAKKEERIFNSTMIKQETLEEAAENYAKTITHFPQWNEHDAGIFKAGAKWQQERSYSEEEVLEIAEQVRWQAIGDPLEFTKNFDKWFEQFKKK